jgi:hypothetical protein
MLDKMQETADRAIALDTIGASWSEFALKIPSSNERLISLNGN